MAFFFHPRNFTYSSALAPSAIGKSLAQHQAVRRRSQDARRRCRHQGHQGRPLYSNQQHLGHPGCANRGHILRRTQILPPHRNNDSNHCCSYCPHSFLTQRWCYCADCTLYILTFTDAISPTPTSRRPFLTFPADLSVLPTAFLSPGSLPSPILHFWTAIPRVLAFLSVVAVVVHLHGTLMIAFFVLFGSDRSLRK